MITLQHAVRVDAPQSQVYRAFTSLDDLAGWHLGQIDGEIAPGQVFRLTANNGLRFGWRTDALDPNRRIRQTCVEGPDNAIGRTLTISFSEATDGRTSVTLQDAGWREDDAHLALCNTYWGAALIRARTFLEGAEVKA